MKKLFSGIVILVLLEIAFFIFIGNKIGILSTLLLIVLMSMLGAIISKRLGFESLRNIQMSLQKGNPPGHAMIDAFLIFVGGLLLLLPGFISDVIALTMIIPFTRKMYKPFIYNWLRKKMTQGNVIIIQK